LLYNLWENFNMEYFFRNSEFLEIIQTSSKIEHTKYLKYLSSFKNIHARMDNYRLHCYVMAYRFVHTKHLGVVYIHNLKIFGLE